MDPRVGDAHVVLDEQLRPVGAPVHGAPCGAVRRLHHHAGRVRIVRVHDPDVVRAAVAAGALEGEETAVPAPLRPAVARRAVGDAPVVPGPRVEHEDLVALGPALVHPEGESRASGPSEGPAHRLLEEGELLTRSSRHGHVVQLSGVREARADEDGLSVLGPVLGAGPAGVLVAVELVHDALRDLGHRLQHHPVVVDTAGLDLGGEGWRPDEHRGDGQQPQDRPAVPLHDSLPGPLLRRGSA
jgi:hypothetical protein